MATLRGRPAKCTAERAAAWLMRDNCAACPVYERCADVRRVNKSLTDIAENLPQAAQIVTAPPNTAAQTAAPANTTAQTDMLAEQARAAIDAASRTAAAEAAAIAAHNAAQTAATARQAAQTATGSKRISLVRQAVKAEAAASQADFLADVYSEAAAREAHSAAPCAVKSDIAESFLPLPADYKLSKLPASRLALAIALQANVPVMVWGLPGIGKSATIGAVADSFLHMPLTTLIASLYEPAEFNGLMRLPDAADEKRGVTYIPPDFLIDAAVKPVVLFFDEITTASPAVQAALLRLVLERKVGKLSLHPETRLVLAGNPAGTAASYGQLVAPLANRALHLNWAADLETWREAMLYGWQIHNAQLPAVDSSKLAQAWLECKQFIVSNVDTHTALVDVPNDDSIQQGYSTPRSNTTLARVLAAYVASNCERKDVLELLVKGLVGRQSGRLVERWRFRGLPSASDVIDGRAACVVPSTLDARVDYIAGLTEAVKAEAAKSQAYNTVKPAYLCYLQALAAYAQAGAQGLAEQQFKSCAAIGRELFFEKRRAEKNMIPADICKALAGFYTAPYSFTVDSSASYDITASQRSYVVQTAYAIWPQANSNYTATAEVRQSANFYTAHLPLTNITGDTEALRYDFCAVLSALQGLAPESFKAGTFTADMIHALAAFVG